MTITGFDLLFAFTFGLALGAFVLGVLSIRRTTQVALLAGKAYQIAVQTSAAVATFLPPPPQPDRLGEPRSTPPPTGVASNLLNLALHPRR